MTNDKNKNISFFKERNLRCNDQLKFVIISDRHDYDYAKKIIKLIKTDFPKGNILFSPVTDFLPLDKLAGWILEDNLPVRFQMQLHKFIWPDMERGV